MVTPDSAGHRPLYVSCKDEASSKVALLLALMWREAAQLDEETVKVAAQNGDVETVRQSCCSCYSYSC